jgi:rubrerythrin
MICIFLTPGLKLKVMLYCPTCRKRYSSGILTCPLCMSELLPQSMIELRDRHPELVPRNNHRARIPLKETYVDLVQCSLNEAKEISSLLEPEGIICMIERDDGFSYDFQLEGGSRIADQQALVIKVKAEELSKARALLDWEVNQGSGPETIGADEEREPPGIVCPACGTEVPEPEEECPGCGLSLDSNEPEEDEAGIYRCSMCGAPSDPEEFTCGSCGARFDH